MQPHQLLTVPPQRELRRRLSGRALGSPTIAYRASMAGTASRTTRTKGKSATHRAIGQPVASSKPVAVAQQVQASSGNFVCAVLYGWQTPRRTHCTQMTGKKTTERPSVRAVNPCEKARLVEFTRTCTADDSRLSETSEPSTVARVLLALPTADFKHAQTKRGEYASTRIGHDILQTSSTSDEALDLVADPPQPDRVHPEDGPNSQRRRKDFAHIHHPHPLCDAPTPAVLCLSLCKGNVSCT